MTRRVLAPRGTCPPDHPHGAKSTCYIQHRCGCADCRQQNTARAAVRARLHAYGRFDTGLVDAEPVRQHLRYLAACGMGYKQVAVVAGVSRTGVRTILFGRQDAGPRYRETIARCDREKAARILAVQPDIDSLADGARISSRGVIRRVEALAVLGYSRYRVAQELGLQLSNLMITLEQDQVTVAKHRAIAAVYDRLSHHPATGDTWQQRSGISRTRRAAEARGWVAPLGWDDIDLDVAPPEPDGDVVDELAIDHAVAGHPVTLTRPERIAAVVRLTAAGHSNTDVADRLQLHPRQVQRDLADHRTATEQETA